MRAELIISTSRRSDGANFVPFRDLYVTPCADFSAAETVSTGEAAPKRWARAREAVFPFSGFARFAARATPSRRAAISGHAGTPRPAAGATPATPLRIP